MSRAIRSPRASLLLVALTVALAGCGVAPEARRTPAPAAPTVSPSAPPASTPSPSAAPSAAPAVGGTYLALGDSITFGIGVPRPYEQGYVARVADALGTGVPRIEEARVFAVPGETATGFLERRFDEVARTVEELGPRVELVTIGLGANELLRTRREPACLEQRDGAGCQALVAAAVAEAAGALDRIVGSVQEELVAAGSGARILLLAYYNPDPDPLADATVAGADGQVACDGGADAGLNDRIACIAESRGVELVDLHAAFRGRELELTRFADGDVHPNAAGYAVIADTILDVLEAGA